MCVSFILQGILVWNMYREFEMAVFGSLQVSSYMYVNYCIAHFNGSQD